MEKLMDNENLWHLQEHIFGYLNHDTVEICRKVCKSWNESLKRISLVKFLQIARHWKYVPGWYMAVQKDGAQASMEDLQEVKDSVVKIEKLEIEDNQCQVIFLPVHGAARIGAVKFMNLILTTSYDMNTTDRRKQTALHLACQNGKIEIVQLLIASSKDFSIDLNAFNARDNHGRTAWHSACENGRTEIVQLLITSSKDYSIDLNARDDSGRTALRLACNNGRTEIVKLIIASSKNFSIDLNAFNARDNHGRTAWHSACENGRTEIVQFLMTSSKDYSIDLNARDDSGRTALRLACQNHRTEAVEVIVKNWKEFGIDIKAQDNQGRTQLDIVRWRIGISPNDKNLNRIKEILEDEYSKMDVTDLDKTDN